MSNERLEGDIAERMTRVGVMVRQARRRAGLTLDDVVATTGVGKRFIHELETGKPTVQFGRAIIVAEAVGIRFMDAFDANAAPTPASDDPDMPDEGYDDPSPGFGR